MIASTPSNHPLGGPQDFGRSASPLELACARLKSAGLRITKPRIAIIEALIRRNRPVSIEQLHQDLADDACDLVTVYRCLAVFEQLGLVRRCFFHNGTSLYEIGIDDAQHYHIVCRECGKVERIEASVGESITLALQERGYAKVTHMLEFFGICADCQAKRAAQPAESPAITS